jgi:hypothetical protein
MTERTKNENERNRNEKIERRERKKTKKKNERKKKRRKKRKKKNCSEWGVQMILLFYVAGLKLRTAQPLNDNSKKWEKKEILEKNIIWSIFIPFI